MLAQNRLEFVRPLVSRPRKRKHVNILRALMHNQMACILLLAVAVLLLLIPYASAYARVTQKGYHKADLLSHLRNVRLESESLRLDLEALRQPDRIAQFAVANGMEQSSKMAYLRPTGEPRLAQNVDVR